MRTAGHVNRQTPRPGLRALASVVIRAEGREHRSAEAQGYDPERVTDAPHEETVVVHLPRERIVFQGDLFYFDGEATFPPRNRRTIMPFFARWLTRRGLAPERIYGYHDRGFATMEHVRRVLAAEGPATEGSAARRPRGRARRGRT